MKKIDSRTAGNLVGVHPKLKAVIEAAYQLTDFVVVCGVRTIAEQQLLYAQGRTRPGLKVTNCDGITNKSNHQVHADGLGYAVDLYADTNKNQKVDSVEINDINALKAVAKQIKQTAEEMGVRVEWGGDWKMKDCPHFELK